MKFTAMLLAVLLMNTGCIKYKKTSHPEGSGDAEGATDESTSGDGSSEAGDTTEGDATYDTTSTDEGTADAEGTSLTGSLLATIASTAKNPAFEVAVNLNGKHSKAKKVEIVKDEARIVISNLPAIKSGQLKLEVYNGKDLQFSTRLSNVTTVAENDLKVVLNRCRSKPKGDVKEKEVICNWSAEQAMQ